MKKLNTKYCRGRGSKPDYRDRVTEQERTVENGFNRSANTLKVTGKVVVDGVEYLTLTV